MVQARLRDRSSRSGLVLLPSSAPSLVTGLEVPDESAAGDGRLRIGSISAPGAMWPGLKVEEARTVGARGWDRIDQRHEDGDRPIEHDGGEDGPSGPPDQGSDGRAQAEGEGRVSRSDDAGHREVSGPQTPGREDVEKEIGLGHMSRPPLRDHGEDGHQGHQSQQEHHPLGQHPSGSRHPLGPHQAVGAVLELGRHERRPEDDAECAR